MLPQTALAACLLQAQLREATWDNQLLACLARVSPGLRPSSYIVL